MKRFDFDSIAHMQFGRAPYSEVLVGTVEHEGKLFDANTGLVIRSFSDESIANGYTRNIVGFFLLQKK